MPRAGLTRVIADAKRITHLPDGSPIPSPLKHALLVLATYWPHIWPSQATLAMEMGISERSVNRRLRRLEKAELITRRSGGGARATTYGLALGLIRQCGGVHSDAGVPEVVTPPSEEGLEELEKADDFEDLF